MISNGNSFGGGASYGNGESIEISDPGCINPAGMIQVRGGAWSRLLTVHGFRL
jgi:hypothetical protein